MSRRGRAGGGAAPRGRPPLGIAIYCVLGFLGALVTFFDVAVLVDQGGVLALVGYVTGAFTIVFVVILIGLWTLRSWAWTAGIVVLSLDVLFHAIAFNPLPLLLLSGLWIYLYVKKPLYRM